MVDDSGDRDIVARRGEVCPLNRGQVRREQGRHVGCGFGVLRHGLVLLGGLNPMAAVVEAGIEVQNIGESGIIDYERLVSFKTL